MPISVIIADDQAAHLGRLRDYWRNVLGDAPRYDMASDLQEVARRLANRPHVVIVDNQFAEAANEGATFIAANKAAYPDTIFVLMTGNGFDIEQLGQRTPNPDFIVPKSYLLFDGYVKFIGEAIRGALKRTGANVSVPAEGLEAAGISRDAFISLVEQCICSLEVLDFDLKAEPTASFELLSGGFSGAVVYQMAIRGSGRTPALPLVLKCGRRDQIQREIRAFERWVRWQLPHDMRVDVIGRGVTRDHAAVCYGFVLGSSDRLSSLAKAIGAADQDLVKRSLERIFLADRTGWYQGGADGLQSLCSYLLNLNEFEPSKDERRNNRFRATLLELAAVEGFSVATPAGDLVVFGRSYGSVRRAVTAVDGPRVKLTYCHGDLNANNVFLDVKHDGLALIDFEQSGESHIFRDFISAETSVRMDLPPELTQTLKFEELVALEEEKLRSLPPPTANDATYGGWLDLVRSLAWRRFPSAHTLDYLVPLVLHSWRVLGITKWPNETGRRLAAVVLAGLRTLAHESQPGSTIRRPPS